MKHLIMNLESPIMSFGGETIDNLGVTRRFPAASMLTGIFANALGWRRIERGKHQSLQDRLIFAARIEREPAGGVSMQDFQTAQLGSRDRGWTTRGYPEGRAGGANTYNAPHLRYRDYLADMRVTLALRLREPNANDAHAPTLDALADALQHPQRPLFIGRKPCLPSVQLYGGFHKGDSCLAALLDLELPHPEHAPPRVAMQWHDGEDKGVDLEKSEIRSRSQMLTDERNWRSGLHGGGRLVHEGSVDKDRFGANDDPAQDREKDGET